MPAYGSLCTAFYDLDKPAAPPDALAFYLDRARHAGGPTLEPMCGSGRFLLPMVQAGVRVDGVDASAPMLEACRARAEGLGLGLGLTVKLHLQDLTDLQLPDRYALAFISSGSIGLVTDEQALRRTLEHLRAHLEPGGTLLLELSCDDLPLTEPKAQPTRTVRCPDGSSITYSCIASPGPTADTVHYAARYIRRLGERILEAEDEALTQRRYEPQWLVALLRACGFGAASISGASQRPFLAESGCVLVEARVHPPTAG